MCIQTVTSTPPDTLTRTEINAEIAKLAKGEDTRAKCLQTASKVCAPLSATTGLLHMCLCLPFFACEAGLSANHEDKQPSEKTRYEKMCGCSMKVVNTWRNCWEGPLSAPENSCDLLCLAFRHPNCGGEYAPTLQEWKEVSLSPPEHQRMQTLIQERDRPGRPCNLGV